MNKISCAVAANSFSLPVPTYSPPPNLPPNHGDSLENLLNCKAPIPNLDSAISDTGATSIYLTPKAPCANINPNAPKILVGTAGRPPLTASDSCNLLLSNLPHISGHRMPQFHHNLMGIGPLCDHGCRVLFEKKTVTVYLQDDDVLLCGWREPRGSRQPRRRTLSSRE